MLKINFMKHKLYCMNIEHSTMLSGMICISKCLYRSDNNSRYKLHCSTVLYLIKKVFKPCMFLEYGKRPGIKIFYCVPLRICTLIIKTMTSLPIFLYTKLHSMQIESKCIKKKKPIYNKIYFNNQENNKWSCVIKIHLVNKF